MRIDEEQQRNSFFLIIFLQWLEQDFSKSLCVELFGCSSGTEQISGLDSELTPCYLESVHVLGEAE